MLVGTRHAALSCSFSEDSLNSDQPLAPQRPLQEYEGCCLGRRHRCHLTTLRWPEDAVAVEDPPPAGASAVLGELLATKKSAI